MTENVRSSFEYRKKVVLDLIQQSLSDYEEIGIFGSYARGDYKASSDIDFCVIVKSRPDRHISGELRELAESNKADIIFVSRTYFEYDKSRFAENLRKEYRRLI